MGAHQPTRLAIAPAPSGGRGVATVLFVLAALGAAAGAFFVGRSQGAADEREALQDQLAEERRGSALLTQLSDKQAALIEQLQQLNAVTEQTGAARAALAHALRESVELSASLLLLEEREDLAPLGRLDNVERAARAALEPYEGRENEALAPSSLGVKTAAQTLLGDVLFVKGNLPEAIEARRAALALARLRQTNEPALVARRLDVVRAHEALAEALDAGADAAGAWAERQEALRLLKALNDEQPAELLWLGALADALGRASGTLAALGRAPDALAHADQAVALARGLHTKERDEARWLRVLARALVAKAACLSAADRSAALATYDEALALLEAPAGTLDTDAGLVTERADLLFARGQLLARAGQAEEAVAGLREALDAAVDVVARDPLARAGQERLARVCSALAAALDVGAEPDDALRGREEAVSAWRRVSLLDPARLEPRHELLNALLMWGDALVRLQRLDEALAAFHEGTVVAAALAESVGTHADSGSDLAEFHDRVAATLLALGRRAEALEAWRTALSVIEPLAKKTPENAFWQADLARIWWHLGQTLLAREPDRAEGTRALKRALRLLTPLESSRRLPDYAATWPASLREALGTAGDAPEDPAGGR